MPAPSDQQQVERPDDPGADADEREGQQQAEGECQERPIGGCRAGAAEQQDAKEQGNESEEGG